MAAAFLTTAAYHNPDDALLPTLAFFTWALLFARAAVVLPGALGLFPRAEDAEELEGPPDATWPADEEVHRIEH